eukprot:scaffold22.g6137.t1
MSAIAAQKASLVATRAFTTRRPQAPRRLRLATMALSQDELKKQAGITEWGMLLQGPLHRLHPRRARAPGPAAPPAPLQAAWKAVEYVKSGQVVGLGTGSTAAFAVDRIGQLLKDGTLKDIVGVPTSIRTYEQAKRLGIPLATLDEQPKLDVAIDGADEVDPSLDVVKGRGGALLREKMVEKASAKFVCIVDETKLVEGLGGSKDAMPHLPEVAGCTAKLRTNADGSAYVTDNRRVGGSGRGGGRVCVCVNYIVDLYFETPIKDAHAASKAILDLEGVVDHGLFLDMVDVCIIAGSDGVEVKERK